MFDCSVCVAAAKAYYQLQGLMHKITQRWSSLLSEMNAVFNVDSALDKCVQNGQQLL